MAGGLNRKQIKSTFLQTVYSRLLHHRTRRFCLSMGCRINTEDEHSLGTQQNACVRRTDVSDALIKTRAKRIRCVKNYSHVRSIVRRHATCYRMRGYLCTLLSQQGIDRLQFPDMRGYFLLTALFAFCTMFSIVRPHTSRISSY
jgi:hypothetical protein